MLFTSRILCTVLALSWASLALSAWAQALPDSAVVDTSAADSSATAPAAADVAERAAEITLTPMLVRVADDPFNNGAGPERRTNRTSVEAAEFSSDGALIATVARADASVRLWRAEDGEELWRRFHKTGATEEQLNDVEAVTFSPSGDYVVSGGEDGRLRVWDVAGGAEVAALGEGRSIEGLRFSHGGHLLAAGDEAGQIRVYDTTPADPAAWTRVATLAQGPDQDAGGPAGTHADVNSVDFTADDRLLVSGGRNAEVKVWETAAFGADSVRADSIQAARVLTGHTGSIKSVRVSPDGQYVAAGAGTGSDVRVWNLQTGELVKHLSHSEGNEEAIVEAVAWTPDGRYLFVGGNSGSGPEGYESPNVFRVYRAPGFERVLMQPSAGVEYFYFSEDGRRLLTGHNRDNSAFTLWQVQYAE